MYIFKLNLHRAGQLVMSRFPAQSFGPWSNRFLHNLAANTFDKVSAAQEGAPIIIMHGLFGTKQNWNSIGKSLNAYSSPTRKVIAVDARNHGESPHTSTHSYDELAEDIHDFLGVRGIEKVVIIGHSMGGRAMMTFAFKYPEMVEKAVIVDISPVRSSTQLQSMKLIFGSMLEVNVPSELNMKAARSLADKLLKKTITNDETRGFIMMNFVKHPDGSYGWKANVETLHKEFPEHISRFPPELKASSCSVPTLFVAGKHSDFITPDELPAIQKIFPNSSLVFLDSGHLVHIERPQELLKLILGFIDVN